MSKSLSVAVIVLVFVMSLFQWRLLRLAEAVNHMTELQQHLADDLAACEEARVYEVQKHLCENRGGEWDDVIVGCFTDGAPY